MERCSECGSWDAQCSSEEPQKGCFCVRCACDKIDRLENALRRIGSMEAFEFSFMLEPDKDIAHAELRARIDYARLALEEILGYNDEY